jgi:3'-phosphoadenosine 5'-phosphosulfate sulfotransferase (PAPS reductase)/FAD synthetase
MTNPFLVQGPAVISFSGGRTSAFMLHEILAAHGGALPSDIIVGFANTGKEREETLRFVHECGSRWNVDIHWIEWRNAPEQREPQR